MAPRRSRWSSFVADPPAGARPARGPHEPGNDRHRVRVEFDRDTLLVHLSDEDGDGWTCLAVDRVSRASAVARRRTQRDAAAAAYRQLRPAVGEQGAKGAKGAKGANPRIARRGPAPP